MSYQTSFVLFKSKRRHPPPPPQGGREVTKNGMQNFLSEVRCKLPDKINVPMRHYFYASFRDIFMIYPRA
jgi:hypothetical protein